MSHSSSSNYYYYPDEKLDYINKNDYCIQDAMYPHVMSYNPQIVNYPIGYYHPHCPQTGEMLLPLSAAVAMVRSPQFNNTVRGVSKITGADRLVGKFATVNKHAADAYRDDLEDMEKIKSGSSRFAWGHKFNVNVHTSFADKAAQVVNYLQKEQEPINRRQS